jgi:hypothetical protein
MQPAPFKPVNPPKKGGAGVPGRTMVGLYKLNPVYPLLESAWFQPLRL